MTTATVVMRNQYAKTAYGLAADCVGPPSWDGDAVPGWAGSVTLLAKAQNLPEGHWVPEGCQGVLVSAGARASRGGPAHEVGDSARVPFPAEALRPLPAQVQAGPDLVHRRSCHGLERGHG